MAQSLGQHLNRVLNLTVSDSHLSVSPITGRDGDAFELTRVTWAEGMVRRVLATEEVGRTFGKLWFFPKRYARLPVCPRSRHPHSSGAVPRSRD